jgi:cytochrome c553
MKLDSLAFALAVILPCSTAAGVALAAKSDSCAHCHGVDGNSSAGVYPTLAGQTKEYVYRQIKDFKEGRRKNSMMSPSVGILSDQDMLDLAEYFSAQNATRGSFKPEPALVAEGKKIADEAQCASCHQPGYKGLNEFPRLARQKYPYLVKQLKDFRDGTRTNDGGVMGPTTKNLTDEQIQALAQYLSSL